MPKDPIEVNVKYPVESSNLKSLEFKPGAGPNKEDVISVEFKRAGVATYHYFPCTKKEMAQGLDAKKVSEWFNTFKLIKTYRQA